MIRKLITTTLATLLALGTVLALSATPATATTITACYNDPGWTLTNGNDDGVTVVDSNVPAAVGLRLEAGDPEPTSANVAGSGLLVVVLDFDSLSVLIEQRFGEEPACPPPTTTTTSTTTPPPTTSTSFPPTSTTVTTTTTAPPTTTTVTTVPPSTTTTPPVTTTVPPTSTSIPPTTTTVPPSTTVPPTISIDVDIACEPERDPYEPLYTVWHIPPELVGAFSPTVTFVIYLDGVLADSITPTGLPTPGFHDQWFTEINQGLNALVKVETVIDDVLVATFEKDCRRVEPPVVTDPPPRRQPCDENHPAWNPETEKCYPTGVPTGNGNLPNTGAPWDVLALIGASMLVVGAGTVAWRSDEQ